MNQKADNQTELSIENLELDRIRCDAGTQCRTWINQDVIADYADRMKEGDAFPPLDVFSDGKEYILADGFHRVFAAMRNGLKSFRCRVFSGGADDALWHAIGANRSHGLRRTGGDVKRSIELALFKFSDRTQEAIAKQIGCTQGYVAKVKAEIIPVNKLATVKGKDGKTYPASKRRKPRSKAVLSESEPDEKPRVVAHHEVMKDKQPQAILAEINLLCLKIIELGSQLSGHERRDAYMTVANTATQISPSVPK